MGNWLDRRHESNGLSACAKAAYPAPEHVVDHIDREGVEVTQSEIVLFGDEPAEEQLRHVLDEALAA
ncbi:hypothetical protein T492DRAFT_1088931 [Pavlovales sp. CCMP2436]|nr:hypothetical protein T492DRAFT_1088931 [Pavlovales sp. CCMP2436]